ncbi:hypothetical protein CERSUDRAFT_78933 [Gelatoporia subvermispora B]|uniref:Uncharacterized protein n=1 Tax=Ceriporiopsis subvermispora (strain B) TaxID=914234 RepID=M2QVZ1_CERS8|nr:hypothetical protein CERSUDRAFT_78933 [Gelatoporia subvermispora B]
MRKADIPRRRAFHLVGKVRNDSPPEDLMRVNDKSTRRRNDPYLRPRCDRGCCQDLGATKVSTRAISRLCANSHQTNLVWDEGGADMHAVADIPARRGTSWYTGLFGSEQISRVRTHTLARDMH